MGRWNVWRFIQCLFGKTLCLSAIFGAVAATSCQGHATADAGAERVDALPPAVIHDFMNACTAFASAAEAQDAMSMFIQFAHSNAKNPDTETSRSLVTKAQSLQRYGFS
ncbi:MAG: hypothetical protein LBR89_01420, partial [Holosporales bacterium]|nr:hypothetical protein [Holosporales bacterium]